ncbi:MAG: 50S ribosomal protein L37e [Candidatus Aenigmarchaeota archaeon]|nr:50S ribosomal protein L37e [Candidatus Aenigmarchaeota archaeon]
MPAKGSPSMGKRQKKSHTICRRCGKHAYHVSHRYCAHCGFGRSSRIRQFNWQWKDVLGKGQRKI